MPQIPFLQRVIREAGRVAGRFPLTLLCAVAGCLAGFQVVTYLSGEANQPDWTFPLLSAGLLGLPLTRGGEPVYFGLVGSSADRRLQTHRRGLSQ